MGFFGGLTRIGKGVAKLSKPLLRSPVGKVIKAVPVIGSVAAAADLAMTGYDLFNSAPPDASPALPALPAVQGSRGLSPSRMRTLPRRSSFAPTFSSSVPAVGTMQLPMNVPGSNGLPPMLSLDQGRVYYRAPKGYVTVEWQGKKFFMLKVNAKTAGLWRPNKKPPISVTDWSNLKGANRTVKKLKRVNKMAQNVANFKTTRTKTVTKKRC